MKNFIFIAFVIATRAFAGEAYLNSPASFDKFDLASLPGSKTSSGALCDDTLVPIPKAIVDLTDLPRSDKFWTAQTRNGDLFVKVTRQERGPKEYLKTMGMTNKDALLASRDTLSDSVFTPAHEQGDVANRWGHSVMYRIPGELIKNLGASQILTTIVGFLASLPKEYLYDRHPSASDIPVTYSDRLGTRSSSFEITVFGDTFYNHRPFEGKVTVFKGSAPFVTWRKVF